MSWHSNQALKKVRPGIGRLASLLLVSIMVIVAMAFGAGAVAADGPTPPPPRLNLLVDGKQGQEVETYFEVSCIKPGDFGSEPIVIKNTGTDDGAVLFKITDLTDDDNGINEPEDVVDGVLDGSDGTPDGDLGDNLYIRITTDGSIIGEGFASDIEDVEYFIGWLPSGSEITIEFRWSVDWGVSDIIQTDSCVFDMQFILQETLPPTPTPSPTPPPGGGGGGGGGLPPRFWLDVDMWGKVTSGDRTAFGILVEIIEAVSDDGVVTLLLRERTEVLDLEGNPISLITVEPVEEPPSLPPGAYAIDAYDFTPHCTFDPAIEMVLLYSEEALPDGFDEVYLVIQYYDEESGEWRELPTVVDTYANTASILIGHLTVFAIVARPPVLTITSLLVSPIEVDPGDNVTIIVEVANTGATPGSQTIELWIEGEFEESQEVTLDPGAAESITFTVSREEAGTYRVAVDGFRGEFEVIAPGFNYWPLIGGILGGLLILGALAYLLLRWRAAERKRHEEATGGQL